MNFDNEAPVDALIGQLLAFIVMFEKKVNIPSSSLNKSSANWPGMNSFIQE